MSNRASEPRADGDRAALAVLFTAQRVTEEAGEASIYAGAPEDYAAAVKAARKRRPK